MLAGAGGHDGKCRLCSEDREQLLVLLREGVDTIRFDVDDARHLVPDDERHGQVGAGFPEAHYVPRVLAHVSHARRLTVPCRPAGDPLALGQRESEHVGRPVAVSADGPHRKPAVLHVVQHQSAVIETDQLLRPVQHPVQEVIDAVAESDLARGLVDRRERGEFTH